MKIENTPYYIAEIGQAHEGSLGILHSYIDALATTGVHAIKFQMHIAEAESSNYEPFRVKFSFEDATRYDYWKRMEFTLEQWKEIKQHCDAVGLDFICSPFSNLAVDWLEEIGVKYYKIGSGEVSNLLLIEKIAQTKKTLILSSGMSSFSELDTTVAFLQDKKAEELGVEKVSLDDLFKRSDFITLHTPLTEKTKNIIGKESFSKMKKVWK